MIQDWILENFSIDYESSTANSYLVARGKKEIAFKGYQIEMITNNSIPGILTMDVRQKNDVIGLYYNVTSKITLSQFMARKRLNRNEFISIFADIIKTLIDSGRFLLSDNCFVLHEDYIYINPSSDDVYLMYFPADLTEDTAAGLKSFITRILVEKVNFDDSSNDNFMQRILSFVRSDVFTIIGLYSLLNQLNNEKAPKLIHNAQKKSENVSFEEKEPFQKQVATDLKKKEDKIPTHSGKYNHSIPTPLKGESRIIKNNEKADSKKEEDKKDGKSNPIIIAVLVQLLAVIIFFVGKGYLLNMTGDRVSAYGGIGIVIFAADLLIMRKIFDKYEEKGKGANAFKRAITSDIMLPATKGKIVETSANKEEIFKAAINKGEDIGFAQSISPNDNIRKEFNDEASILADSYIDETTVLCEKASTAPYLTYKHDGIEEKITIAKNSFIIGRLHGQADYVTNNNAVGKLHAEIITRGNSFFIKDLNSRNGSFVNGEQLMPSKEKEIKSGDKITIANSDFVFIASVG